MTKAQNIIKYIALVFALFLIVTIFSIIAKVLYGLTKGLTTNLTLESIQCSYENIKSLDINIDYSNLEIRNSDSFNIQTNNKNISCENINQTLIINEKENWFNYNYQIIIDIPIDFNFENLTLESGVGTVKIDSVFSDKIKLDLGVGKTEIASLVTNNAIINTGIGKVQIGTGKIGNLNFNMGIGEVNISSILFGLINIDTGIGSLNLNLLDSIDNYKINIEGLGNVKVNSKKLENNQIGNGENIINIDSSIGTVSLNYNE